MQCISSTVSCSLHYNVIVQYLRVTYMYVKKTQHLSTLGEKQSQHFAVSSQESFYILTRLKQSCFFNCKLMTFQTPSYPEPQLKNSHPKRKKKKDLVTPSTFYIMPHEILVSLMILYVCNTFICQIGKYACWPSNRRRLKNFSLSLS